MTARTDYEQALYDEIAAMRRIVRALEPLSAQAKDRVVRYLADRYCDQPTPAKEPT